MVWYETFDKHEDKYHAKHMDQVQTIRLGGTKKIYRPSMLGHSRWCSRSSAWLSTRRPPPLRSWTLRTCLPQVWLRANHESAQEILQAEQHTLPSNKDSDEDFLEACQDAKAWQKAVYTAALLSHQSESAHLHHGWSYCKCLPVLFSSTSNSFGLLVQLNRLVYGIVRE